MSQFLAWLIALQTILYIPAIGLDRPVGVAPFANGTFDTSQIGDGVARAEGYNWGSTESGRTIILGHNPGAFSDLDKLQVGDRIYLFYAPWADTAVFEVVDIYILPDRTYTDVFTVPIMHWELNLLTCYGDRWLWVRALPVERG